jgi:hypothetical protein
MELGVTLLFDWFGVAVGIGLGVLARQPRRAVRVAVAGALAVALGLFAPTLSGESPLLRVAGIQLTDESAQLLSRVVLFGIMLALARCSGRLAAGVLFGVYWGAVFALFGPYPISGWGLIAVPPLVAGMMLAAARPRQRIVQAVLVLGWSIVVLAPATLMLMNAVDQIEWEISRAATDGALGFSPDQLAALIGTAHQREVAATAIYLLVTAATLGVMWVPLIERLVNAPGNHEALRRRSV